MLNKVSMLANIIDRIRLPFRKDKELYSSLYHIIGFYPHNISYYRLALMHKSATYRNKKGRPANNERLEFLGDAILDAAVGDIVYRHFPGKREGFLTNTRSKLVQRDTLNKLAQELGLSELIRSNGHTSSHNSYMAGNAFEALVGAMYLDRGYDACMTFLKKRILSQMINIDKVAYKEVNFKSKLIEWSQKNRVRISFRLVEEGKDNNGSSTFAYQVMLENIAGCTGSGFSKKESQQNACKDTLDKLRREPQFIDEVFAAKTARTQMEEQPVEAIPETGDDKDFIIVADVHDGDDEPTENVAAETSPVNTDDAPVASETAARQCVDDGDEDFDLSHISARAKSDEKIIAAAEQAAFSEKQS